MANDDKTYKMFRLVSGEEIIATVLESSTTNHKICDVLGVIVTSGRQKDDGNTPLSVQLLPWNPLNDQPVMLRETALVFSSDVPEKLYSNYMRIIASMKTNLVVPKTTQNRLILPTV